jgi:predicted Fe-Mo cluster-binding NifX family protein
MKIAVTSYGEDRACKIDRSFGRAKWFVIMDKETETFEAHSNRQNVNAAQGAGIQAAQNLSDLGVDIIVTGNVGPNAYKTLNAAAIRIFIVGKNIETVEEAISEWESGTLQEVGKATVEGHWL